jgi:hypothetical protein
MQSVDGHCCLIGQGVVHPSLIDLFASIVGYRLVSFRTSHFITPDEQNTSFIKHKLTQTFVEAGIRVTSSSSSCARHRLRSRSEREDDPAHHRRRVPVCRTDRASDAAAQRRRDEQSVVARRRNVGAQLGANAGATGGSAVLASSRLGLLSPVRLSSGDVTRLAARPPLRHLRSFSSLSASSGETLSACPSSCPCVASVRLCVASSTCDHCRRRSRSRSRSLRNVKDNVRVLILLNETNERLFVDQSAIFDNIALVFWPHWSKETLVDNSGFHLRGGPCARARPSVTSSIGRVS